ncbi:MAG TPA: PspC domain-containing protein [Pilimelia sp.]|nr:PspC domain-containing protein [Pilimelia sp.]
MSQNPILPQPPYKQLRRPVTDRVVAGVCSGIGRYFGIDPVAIRVAYAVVTILTGGIAALAYPVMWFIMPEDQPDAPAWPTSGPGAGGSTPGPHHV